MKGFRTAAEKECDARLGRRIAWLRATAGISQKNLGERLGLSFQQIQKYETGSNRVPVSRLISICQVLEIDVPELLAPILSPEADTDGVSSDPAVRRGPSMLAGRVGAALDRVRNPAMRSALADVVTAAAEWESM